MPDSPTAAPLTDPDSLSRVSAQVAALTDGIAGLGLTLPAADPLVIAGAQHQALHVVYLLGSLDVDPDPDTDTTPRPPTPPEKVFFGLLEADGVIYL